MLKRETTQPNQIDWKDARIAVSIHLKEKLSEGYFTPIIRRPLYDFWMSQFIPTCKETHERMLKVPAEIHITRLSINEGKAYLDPPSDLKIKENPTEQQWNIVIPYCKTHLYGTIGTPPVRKNIVVIYDAKISTTVRCEDLNEVEIEKAILSEIKMLKLSVYRGTGTTQEVREHIVLATPHPHTGLLIPNRKGIEELVRCINIALHCERRGINQWAWEIAMKVVEKIREQLRGVKLDLPLPSKKQKKIKDVEIRSSGGKVAYVENIQTIKKVGTTTNLLQAQYPLNVVTESGSKLDGEIEVQVLFFEPRENVRHKIPPTVSLHSIMVTVKSEYGNAVAITYTSREGVVIEDNKLPSPALLVEKGIEEAGRRIAEQLEKQDSE